MKWAGSYWEQHKHNDMDEDSYVNKHNIKHIKLDF